MLRKAIHNKPQGLIQTSQGLLFIKRGSHEQLQAEAEGLKALQEVASDLLIPNVLLIHTDELGAGLLLSGLKLNAPPDWKALALGLSQIHRQNHSCFGWTKNNWIGLGIQKNKWCEHWAYFFAHFRLKPKLKILESNGLLIGYTQKTVALAEDMLKDHHPTPSLVHGDLWSGNIGFTTQQATVFDPAVYYGDREVDLAMSQLFGGFPPSFYKYYTQIYPLSEGFEQRFSLYNLYHLLNHACIFGGNYILASQNCIEHLLNAHK
ncbi:MAG: fructosamine kinase family protein [Proteobacteria bacterium]|nr:fructosamine kinase family protein [Pseudomonadota bacterium]